MLMNGPLNKRLITMTRKKAVVITTDTFPNILKLVELRGLSETSLLLGLTHVGKMIREGKVRLAYELAAEMLLSKEDKQITCDDVVYVVKVPLSKKDAVVGILNAMELEYLDISF